MDVTMAEELNSQDHTIKRLTEGCVIEGQQQSPPAVSIKSLSDCSTTMVSTCDLRPKQIGKKIFPCNLCTKVFRQMSKLTIHMRTHTGEKPYSCDFCDKSFTSSIQLTVHRRIHTGEKPYHCVVCKKSFTNHSHLHVHKRVHTGEKPYQCDVCKKSFRQRCHLKLHQQTHAVKRHCGLCDCTFCQQNSLAEHKWHTPIEVKLYYPCESCDEDFTTDVTPLSVCDIGDGPYLCDVCGKLFAQKGEEMRRHRQTHKQS
ncbi:unnamed protein product [Aphis gossypii]|uniref:C2H2-type domain-containing protein n=1 Tax=Aphis gossypii TaxID=80765 RepID=A0A9P0JD81_APHGO|nr:unnamed protein product [Aphis gossypii]